MNANFVTSLEVHWLMMSQHSAVLQRTVKCPLEPDSTPTLPIMQLLSLPSLFMLLPRTNNKGPPYDSVISFFHAGSASGGLANASFANFDNFPKSCSADFGSFSSSSQSNSTGAGRDAVQSTSVLADRYAAFVDLDNMFSSAITEQGKLLLPSLFHRSQLYG